MLFYASGEVSEVLRRSSSKIDREATAALVARLYPSHQIRPIADGSLCTSNPAEGRGPRRRLPRPVDRPHPGRRR
jgi:hypothetical protein